ncbi:MAG: NIF family HAD-type phosphatase [Candidatus Woesearchaeota archaeon]
MNILSLDLEGVLVVTANQFNNSSEYIGTDAEFLAIPRNHYQTFLSECEKLFDVIYINTVVSDKTAKLTVDKLGLKNYKFWQWTPPNKMANMDKLSKDNIVIHIEDGMPESDLKLAKLYNVNYIEITPYDRPMPDNNELLEVLNKINQILK